MSESINSFTDARGVEMVAVEGARCDGCAYDMADYCIRAPACGSLNRSDRRNIVWQPKESK